MGTDLELATSDSLFFGVFPRMTSKRFQMQAILSLVRGHAADKQFTLSPAVESRVGRGSECEVALQDPLSSRIHATLLVRNGQWVIRDAGSRNGTLVNGSKIDEAVLMSGARVRIGNTEFLFSDDSISDTATKDPSTPSQTLVLNASMISGENQISAINALRDRRRAEDLLDLYQLAYRLLSATTVAETFDIGIEIVRARTRADVVGALWAESDGTLRPQRMAPPESEHEFTLSRKLTQMVTQQGEAVWVQNGNRPVGGSLVSVADAICVPMTYEGKPIGALHVYREAREFENADFEFIVSATNILTAAFLRAQQTSAIEVSRDRLIEKSADFGDLIGESQPMAKLKSMIARVGNASGSVLVRGESGAGKELVAKAIHTASVRSDRPLLCVNCAAIPPELMESHLFGHKKGAFTGADKDHEGWFQQADTGSLFLDEVGEMTPEGQAKLLRILEGHPFMPVGSTKQVKVDVRVIAATNRDLKELVREKKFREDLFYRLSVFEIQVPPLRERGTDIALLLDHFLEHFRKQHGRHDLQFGDKARERLLGYHWPGNVRQLRNVVDSAVVLAAGPNIELEDIGLHDVSEPVLDTLRIDLWEEKLIREALQRARGNINQTIELLGISRSTLYRKMDSYGIDRNEL